MTEMKSNINDDGNENVESGEAEHLRKLFIGGLDYRTTDEGLKSFYEQWGKIVDVIVMKDPKTKRSRGFGFITYSKASMVDEAQKNRPHKIDGKVVEAKRAIPRGVASNVQEANTTVKKIFVAGFKDDITEEDLRKYFGHFGNIVSLTLVKDKENGKSRGFGFIEFDDYDSVDRIIIKGDHIIKSKRLDVKKALNKNDIKTSEKKSNENTGAMNNSSNTNQAAFSGDGNFWNQGAGGPCGPGMGGPGMGPMGYGSNWGMQPAPWQSGPGGMPPVGGMGGPGMNNYMGNQGNYGPGVGMGMGPGPGMGGPGMVAGGMGMGGGYGPGPGMVGGMGMSGGPMVGCAPGMGPPGGQMMNGGMGMSGGGSGIGMGSGGAPCQAGNSGGGMGMGPGMNTGYGMTGDGTGMGMGGNSGSMGMNAGAGIGNYSGSGYGMGGAGGTTGSNVQRGGSNTDIGWSNNSNAWRSSSGSFGSNYGQGSGVGPMRSSIGNSRTGPYDSGNRNDGYSRNDNYGVGGGNVSTYSGSGGSVGYSRRY